MVFFALNWPVFMDLDTYSTANDNISQNYIGSYKIDIELNEDVMYAFITEVDASEETAHLDIYEVDKETLKKLLIIDANIFGFADKAYPIITECKKIQSNLSFEKL